MREPGQQMPHTLSKVHKMVDQVKAQLAKGFVLAVGACGHALDSSKRMVVSCWLERPCWHLPRAVTLKPEAYADVD